MAFFSQFETTNSEQIRVTGFCLLSCRFFLRKLLKQPKVVEPNTPISTHLEMPAILTKLVKFKAKLLAEEDSSDREEAEMEPKIETELDISMSSISYEETDDSDSELPYAEMSKEQQDRFDRKLWRKQFPSGEPPYPTPFTPETDAYWREWASAGIKARQELEKQEAEGDHFDFKEPEEETSSNVSTKPAAIPKAAGRCREGRFCQNLETCSCIYDTSSNVSMGSPSSAQSQNISLNRRREGGDRPGSPSSANSHSHSLNRSREGEF